MIIMIMMTIIMIILLLLLLIMMMIIIITSKAPTPSNHLHRLAFEIKQDKHIITISISVINRIVIVLTMTMGGQQEA